MSASDTSSTAPAINHFSHPHKPVVTVVLIVIPLYVTIALALFAWPATHLQPRDLPVGLVGPAQVTDQIGPHLAANGIDVHLYANENDARAAIEARDVYGALIPGQDGMTLLTASAASPAVAQLLQQAAQTIIHENTGGQAVTLRVVDVVPTAVSDPRGAGFLAAILPLILAGLAIGASIGILTRPVTIQIGLVTGSALLSGVMATLVIQTWLGILRGNWLANASVMTLLLLVLASGTAGFVALLGIPGVGVASLLFMLIGNPWSGLTSAPELLPDWVRITGQLLPPGAAGNALRGTAFFAGNDIAGSLTVLGIWLVIGFGMMGIGMKNPVITAAALRDRQAVRA